MVLNRLVAAVEGRIVAMHAAEYEEIQQARIAARKHVPEQAWQVPIEELNLSTRVESILLDNNITTLGDILMRLQVGDQSLLDLSGFGQKALEEVREVSLGYEFPEPVAEIEVDTEAELAGVDVETEEIEAEVEIEAVEPPAVEEDLVAEEVALEAEPEEAEVEVAEEVAAEEEEEQLIPAIDDLEKPLVQVAKPKKEEEKKRVVVVQPSTAEVDEHDDDRRRTKGKQLIFDEQQGKVVVKRKRKGSRRRREWEEFVESEEILDEEFE